MNEVIVGAVLAVIGGVLAALVAWIRWSLTTAVRIAVETTVNGKIDVIAHDVRGLAAWTSSHDRRHRHERGQMIGALHRAGIDPPDGWEATP